MPRPISIKQLNEVPADEALTTMFDGLIYGAWSDDKCLLAFSLFSGVNLCFCSVSFEGLQEQADDIIEHDFNHDEALSLDLIADDIEAFCKKVEATTLKDLAPTFKMQITNVIIEKAGLSKDHAQLFRERLLKGSDSS